MNIRILVVEGEPVLAARLESLRHEYPDLGLVEWATTGAAAVAVAVELQPDIAFIDRYLPDADGIDICDRLSPTIPDAALIILSTEGSDQLRLRAVESGACGLIAKAAPDQDVVEAILRAADGEFLMSRSVTLRLFKKQRSLRCHHTDRPRN